MSSTGRYLHGWILLLLASCATPGRSQYQSDFVVYGATPGGFCAAIAAAREGASVILLEPTNHVGGANTGGLSHSDSNQTVRATLMGLFDEWHARIERDYTTRGVDLPYEVAVKDQARWTYEPHVAMRVTQQMLDEVNVRVLTGQVLTSVQKENARIQRLTTERGVFKARAFVDGTYEGDLMAAAGVSWTIGREVRGEFGESLAGKQYPKPEMPIQGFDDEGNLLPLITTDDAGPPDEGDDNVMVYSFRLCLTEEPGNRVAFPAPDHYDPPASRSCGGREDAVAGELVAARGRHQRGEALRGERPHLWEGSRPAPTMASLWPGAPVLENRAASRTTAGSTRTATSATHFKDGPWVCHAPPHELPEDVPESVSRLARPPRHGHSLRLRCRSAR